ncbi:NAD(P)-dependent dehydrogenase, short-chain alcohol dehydrogenase family [Chelatococcus sambhunathii]|uniref:NAD(P)-dependent dehydrogenase, short-chain alcohol dehydrogenase family n=1 Tax=Chelatococcus sambhunathii TaxID=363953 RepID=A0ABM9U9G3_9HYPH|nr:SDR family NAD(P)-dependent oxidoreductase [Chelatococcus sambhunathii]CUA90691.1 NAD(P)-dependent dehydrogenase, short-chain alcohol dehydrogenase family [Chelatococcus sambhunathii]
MSPRTAIITGAASGIGRECTRMLLAAGCSVVAIDLKAEAVQAAFPDAGDALRALSADIGDIARLRETVDRAVAMLGGVDALLHFAAIWTGKTWDETEPDEWERVLRINVTGTFFLARYVAEKMIPNGRGAIVLTASDSAKVGGVAGGPAYVASKGAVIGLTHSLAKALGPKGIRVNAVNPGVVRTPMTAAWPAAVKDKAIELTPLGRLAEPDDIASVACFLASEQAKFVTGEVVEVNGGFYFD